jgi:hypothetical protein
MLASNRRCLLPKQHTAGHDKLNESEYQRFRNGFHGSSLLSRHHGGQRCPTVRVRRSASTSS